MTVIADALDPRNIDPAQMQRAVGALVGQAVGDALGAFAEFGPAGQYSERFPSPVLTGTGEMIGGRLSGPQRRTNSQICLERTRQCHSRHRQV